VRVLFDQGTPAPLRHALAGHSVETAYERGWSQLKNGELIAAAQAHGFEVFVTTDKNLKYQQNLANRSMAIVVLQTTSWPRLQRVLAGVVAAIESVSQGGYVEAPAE
jgi:predicted nuclease of predicted toxin-antitoxin system